MIREMLDTCFIEVLLAFTSAEYQARAASAGPWAPTIDVLAARSMEGWHQRRGRCIFGRLDRRPWTKLFWNAIMASRAHVEAGY